ncbi:DUF2183 domain-containing protein [Rhodobacterales bacterium]|nr:DUF2183 domain-containing protein [Rhodobacterales bacterium]
MVPFFYGRSSLAPPADLRISGQWNCQVSTAFSALMFRIDRGDRYTMAMLHNIALTAESWFDRLTASDEDDAVTLDPYMGYTTSEAAVLRGRVLAITATSDLKTLISRQGTVGARVMSFLTNDAGGVEIECGSHKTTSDEEGYFRLEVPHEVVQDGTVDVTVPRTGETFELEVASSSPSASRMVISDIDDTVIKTGAWQKLQNFWRTMTTGVDQREVFQDTVDLIRRRMDGGNPVFYVSSSPWNLHDYLGQVFKAGGVPKGPMFLKDFGIDDAKFIKTSHGNHKGERIDELLDAHPGLGVTLIGDTGQHDGQVYLDAIKRHPERIREVFLRQAGSLSAEDQSIADEIRATGVIFYSGERFGDDL